MAINILVLDSTQYRSLYQVSFSRVLRTLWASEFAYPSRWSPQVPDSQSFETGVDHCSFYDTKNLLCHQNISRIQNRLVENCLKSMLHSRIIQGAGWVVQMVRGYLAWYISGISSVTTVPTTLSSSIYFTFGFIKRTWSSSPRLFDNCRIQKWVQWDQRRKWPGYFRKSIQNERKWLQTICGRPQKRNWMGRGENYFCRLRRSSRYNWRNGIRSGNS